MYNTDSAGTRFLRVCFGKVRSDARPDQLITFARFRHEALPIKYRDLLSAARNQTSTFQFPGSIRDGWPMDTQHFGEQVLSDL
jgi:hypothetical protein